VTRRLHELVPLLEAVGCVMEEISPERTVLSLPLLISAMNQNGTHQASVFYLVADYTVGVGIFGVLPGCYVTGVHDRCAALPIQYWLKRGEVRHLAPGTGKLHAEIRISPDDAARLRRQLFERGRGEYTGVVTMSQDGRVVAEATHTMGVYADIPRNAGARANVFQVQNMTVSALLISGLRDDPISRLVAGEQGLAIASRMSVVTPQLPSLVRARSTHLERLLEKAGGSFSQVLVLGVGFDPKPVKFSGAHQRWFGIDLRNMLRERETRFAAAGAEASNFVPVPGDILSDNWDAAVREAGYLPEAPSLIIAEGISMYFSLEVLARVFRKLRMLANSPESRLWIDHVSTGLFDLDLFEVKSFLASMARLGEPFIAGFDDPSRVAPQSWALVETTSAASAAVMPEPVHERYLFSILNPA
jgi:O-methyltransferase involved in polyketide biosynthesis